MFDVNRRTDDGEFNASPSRIREAGNKNIVRLLSLLNPNSQICAKQYNFHAYTQTHQFSQPFLLLFVWYKQADRANPELKIPTLSIQVPYQLRVLVYDLV